LAKPTKITRICKLRFAICETLLKTMNINTIRRSSENIGKENNNKHGTRAARAFPLVSKSPRWSTSWITKKSSDGSAGLDRASTIGWIGRLIPRKLKTDSSSYKQNWGFAVNFRKCRFQWTGHDGWLG
jgi:hypothetical protein